MRVFGLLQIDTSLDIRAVIHFHVLLNSQFIKMLKLTWSPFVKIQQLTREDQLSCCIFPRPHRKIPILYYITYQLRNHRITH